MDTKLKMNEWNEVYGLDDKELTDVVVPDGVHVIKRHSFKGCKKLKTVVIDTNVTKIGTKAFYGCTELRTINIKSSKIKFIGKKAFGRINKEAKFSIPKIGKARTRRLVNKAK